MRIFLDMDNVHPQQLIRTLFRLKRKFPFLKRAEMHIYRTRREEVQPFHYHFNYQVVITDGTAHGGFGRGQVERVVKAAYGVDLGFKWFSEVMGYRQTLRRSKKRIAGVKRGTAPVYYCTLTPDDRLVYIPERAQIEQLNLETVERILDEK